MKPPLRPLELSDATRVRDCLRRYSVEISEVSFGNLFLWQDTTPVWTVDLEGTLVFLTHLGTDGCNGFCVYGPPLGPLPPARIAEFIPEVCRFRRIPATVAEALAAAGYRVERDPDNDDYVYRVSDLADLPGDKYHRKRNLIGHCLREHRCEYEPITSANLDECRRMQDRWCETRNCGMDPGLCREYAAIRKMFDHYAELALIGGAIRVDGQVDAFAVAEDFAPGLAVGHFEKAMPHVHGLGQVINQWFSKQALLGRFEFINREQDLGIPGLRQAKRSYLPCRMVQKYSAVVTGHMEKE